MATRSTIAMEFADGTVEQIYCHWDGYLENNGAILAQHYKDPFKVQQLIDGGAVSSLGAEIGEQHPFDTYKLSTEEKAKFENWTTFYARDRGEELVKHRYKNLEEYFADCQQEEYDYILTREQGWLVRCYITESGWVSILEAKEMQAAMEEA